MNKIGAKAATQRDAEAGRPRNARTVPEMMSLGPTPSISAVLAGSLT